MIDFRIIRTRYGCSFGFSSVGWVPKYHNRLGVLASQYN